MGIQDVGLSNSKSVDVNAKDNDGKSVLHRAAVNGREAVVRLLLEAKTDVDAKTTYSGWTALYKAAESGHEAVVRLLLEHKAGYMPVSKS